MVIEAALVSTDWIALASLWEAPTHSYMFITHVHVSYPWPQTGEVGSVDISFNFGLYQSCQLLR
jgi:hypothetical protein